MDCALVEPVELVESAGLFDDAICSFLTRLPREKKACTWRWNVDCQSPANAGHALACILGEWLMTTTRHNSASEREVVGALQVVEVFVRRKQLKEYILHHHHHHHQSSCSLSASKFTVTAFCACLF